MRKISKALKHLQQKNQNVNKATNPILKKLACFKNDNLSKKFDINDLI